MQPIVQFDALVAASGRVYSEQYRMELFTMPLTSLPTARKQIYPSTPQCLATCEIHAVSSYVAKG